MTSVAMVVGTINRGDIDTTLQKLGAISGYSGIPYWSVTDARLETLIVDAFAVEPARFDKKRADFAPSELMLGRDLIFSEHDNRLPNPVFYRMRVIHRNQNRVVIDISNINVVKRFMFTLFEPGDLRTALFVSRSADGRMTCYAVSGLHAVGLSGLLDSPRSHLNRLLAFYGYINGIDAATLPWDK
jgi:hypothetical protein